MKILSACPVKNLLQKILKNFLLQVKLVFSVNTSFKPNLDFYKKTVFNGACLLSFLLISLTIFPVFAHTEYNFPKAGDGQIAEALQKTIPLRFLPNNPLYSLLRVKEFTSRLFQPSSAKRAEFDFLLSTKRIKESYLMLEKNDAKKASKSLKDYSQQLNKMLKQIEKARSQNQDVVPIVARMAEEFKYHEILLSAIISKWELTEDGYDFDENLSDATGNFKKAILAINNIQPGLKDRFPSVSASNVTVPWEATSSPLPAAPNTLQATSGARPRRIIY